MEQTGYTVGQRVEAMRDGRRAWGTVKEVSAVTGFVRVEFDRAWMHDWLPSYAVSAAPEPLPLATVVRTPDGKEGVVVRHASCSFPRVEVAWFNRALWLVQRRWYDVARLEVLGSIKQTATEVAVA